MSFGIILTNAILGFECFFLAWTLKHQKTQSPTHRDFTIALLSIGIASLLTSIYHFAVQTFAMEWLVLWKIVLIMIGIIAWFLGDASFGILWPKYYKQSFFIYGLVTLIYSMMVLVLPQFYIAICYYGIALVVLFFALFYAYQQTHHRQIRYGIYSLVLLLIAALLQQSIIFIKFFDGNFLYNILMIPGVYFCYLAILAMLSKHTVDGFKDVYVNDKHSQMNETLVSRVLFGNSYEQFSKIIKKIAENKQNISICGHRHAMGGQQFSENSSLLDMSRTHQVLNFNIETGIIQVEAGISWPQLIRYLEKHQKKCSQFWTFAQKQTGADHLSLGGALSANIHGRGLLFKPFVQDVVSFDLVNAKGVLQTISREHEPELFSLAIGGYGLFGLVYSLKMQLVKRQSLKRKVEVISVNQLPDMFEKRIQAGFLYGDFQFKTNEKANDYLQTGVFSCYQPTTEAPNRDNKFLNADNWNKLLLLAYTDKETAFKRYCDYYLSTDGQCYESDTHQLSYYNDKYIDYIRSFFPNWPTGSLMITEVYVPLTDIATFMRNVANDPLLRTMNVIYGTVRLIKKDDETFLAWAKQDYACVIFNLFVPHNLSGFQYADEYFSRLIEHALNFNGSFFLTYHRFAKKEQILKAYPQFNKFLELKLKYDPNEVFTSNWYQFYKRMFSNANN